MKTLKALVLFLAAAMFIVACGTTDPDNGNGNGNGDPTMGTLAVNVTDSGGDPLTATIVVTDSDGDVVDSQTASSYTWTDVAPGAYTVGVSVSGYQSQTQSATITAGTTTSLAFQLRAVDPSVTTGTLFVSVSDGVAPVEATIVVTDADGDVVDTQTDTSFTWPDVPAGTYTVTVDADGYQQFSDSAEIVAGETTQVFVVLLGEDAFVANVANVSIAGFVDEDGNAYDSQDEINPVVSKLLVAAQTEEMVGVQVLVTDADGEPVANAPVTVSITGDFASTLAIYAGSPVEVMASSTQTFQGLMTDAAGMAYFTIEATNDFATGDFFRDGFGEPVKLIVSAVGGNNVAKRTEFKSWFVNMSHLWYGVTDDGDFIYDDDGDPILTYTENRLGADLGTFINVWDTAGGNAHTFFTYALTKQPSYGPFAVGGQFFYFNNGIKFPVSQAGPGFGWGFPGYMRYTLTDWSTNAAGNRLVEWDASLCDDMTPNGLTCISYGWAGGAEEVALVPAAGVKLEDLPIEATVHATYVYEAPYGQEVYEFELKDYTFTKQWVGGFLTIDKYVDQHVLTWKGQDITRAAFLTNEDDIWTSTIYVTIENPSDSPLYNVTIRDVVPAELGVVTNSISDDGTYDEVNHAVTWNNVTTPGLAVVNPGDVFTFSFDVYARHKPGYCWQLNADETFAYFGDVPPLVDPTLEPNACAYNDPYLVQNGAPYRDASGNVLNGVTVAGFLEDGVAGEQLVFPYNPAADESDIWVVRPFLRLTKDLVSAAVMDVGAAASYRIDVRQIDRVDTVADPGSTEYAFLYDRYPWEFRADLADAPAQWHIADEPPPGRPTATGQVSEVRDNPYARDVQVSDSFEYALDFTQGIDFDGSVFAGGQRVVGKVVNFNAIPSLPRGTLETARLALTGNLPSGTLALQDVDGTEVLVPISQNGAIRRLAADPNLYAWNNCAYLGAPQLNQPHPGSNTFADTFYSGTYPTFPGLSTLWVGPDEPWRAFDEYVEDFANRQVQWHQVDNLDNGDWRPATNLVTGFDGTAPVLGFPTFGPAPTSPVDRLEYCALVAVIPPPPTPLMTLTTNGEVNTAPVAGVFDPVYLDDGFEVGDVFWYVVTAKNAGLETAEDVLITVTLNGPQVRFDGTGELRLGIPEVWGILLEDPTFNNATTHTFPATDVPAGESIRLVLPARANQVGRVDMTTTLTYVNPPAGEALPLEVQEETTIQ